MMSVILGEYNMHLIPINDYNHLHIRAIGQGETTTSSEIRFYTVSLAFLHHLPMSSGCTLED